MPSPKRKRPDADTPGKLQRGLSLDPGDDLWIWFERGDLADARETEDWTRFEGVEGISDAVVRRRRDE